MSTYLAYLRRTRPTGRALAQEMGVPHYGIRPPRERPDVLIRWGSALRMPWVEIPHLLNRVPAILRASNKFAALDRLRDAAIPTVPFFGSWEEALDEAGGSGIILGRDRSGMQGRDIVVYDPRQVYRGRYPAAPTSRHDWYSIYMVPTREMRVHVVGDEVIRTQGKYLDYPDLADRNPFVRNYTTGYRYRSPRGELRSQRREAAIDAISCLGLDFGAVDMLLFGEDQDSMILEVNTAPACSPLTLSAYARALERKVSQF